MANVAARTFCVLTVCMFAGIMWRRLTSTKLAFIKPFHERNRNNEIHCARHSARLRRDVLAHIMCERSRKRRNPVVERPSPHRLFDGHVEGRAMAARQGAG